VLGLSALEYAVLAPAAMVSAVLLLLGADGGRVQAAMTLPWLLVIPGFAAAAWATSPKRAARFCEPAQDGRFREGLAHAVAGVVKRRALAPGPLEPFAGLVGVALFWLGDFPCLWAALPLFSVEISIPALIVAYAPGSVLPRRSLPLGGAGIV